MVASTALMAPNPISSEPSVTRYDTLHELLTHLAYGTAASRAMVTQNQSTETQEVEAEINTSQASQGMLGLHEQVPQYNQFGVAFVATVAPHARREPDPPPPPLLPAPHSPVSYDNMRELNGEFWLVHNIHNRAHRGSAICE